MEMRQRAHIPVEFFANGYRLSGTFDARRASLGDALYDSTSAFVTIHNTYISVIERPAEILSNYPSALIFKNQLDFALTVDHETALRHDQKYSPYQRPRVRALTLVVPFFELSGKLWMPGQVDTQIMFKTQIDSFVVLLDVTARTTADPDITYQGGAAVVKVGRISFVGMKPPKSR